MTFWLPMIFLLIFFFANLSFPFFYRISDTWQHIRIEAHLLWSLRVIFFSHITLDVASCVMVPKAVGEFSLFLRYILYKKLFLRYDLLSARSFHDSLWIWRCDTKLIWKPSNLLLFPIKPSILPSLVKDPMLACQFCSNDCLPTDQYSRSFKVPSYMLLETCHARTYLGLSLDFGLQSFGVSFVEQGGPTCEWWAPFSFTFALRLWGDPKACAKTLSMGL